MERLIYNTDDLVAVASGRRVLRAANSTHFFDPGAMRSFRSRLSGEIFGHKIDGSKEAGYFVTSEQFVPLYGRPEPRRYTIRSFVVSRWVDKYGTPYAHVEVSTAGEFQEYATLAEAKAAARKL